MTNIPDSINPAKNPLIPGSPLAEEDIPDSINPKKNPLIPDPSREDPLPDSLDPKKNPFIPHDDREIPLDPSDMTDPRNNPAIPGFEERRAADTLPELLKRIKVCRLRVGELYLQRLGDCTQIFKNREVVMVDDLEPHEAKALRLALLDEEMKGSE